MKNGQSHDRPLCEYILALGQVNINQDVRDRSRNESLVIHLSIGIEYDADTLPDLPPKVTNISFDCAKYMLLQKKPSSSWLPIESDNSSSEYDGNTFFRFGTLSSMISHKAGGNYLPLPPRAEEDSPKHLRDPVEKKVESRKGQSMKKKNARNDERADKSKNTIVFYDSDSDESASSSSSSDSDSDESSSSDSSSDSSFESSSSSDDSSSDESEDSDSEVERLVAKKVRI